MRIARIKETNTAFYHAMSRMIDPETRMSNAEKERLREQMRAMEGFSGVEVLTYAIMGNHFHLLLHVPQKRELSDEQLVRRLKYLYEAPEVRAIAQQLQQFREQGLDSAAEQLKARYSSRMYDLSEFLKTVKQRFTQSYNWRHGRRGPLWEGRFKSVLVQNSENALMTMAGYIDLNPVRAGLTVDPKDYRFCGYAAALGGSARARMGLERLLRAFGPLKSWSEAQRAYRQILFVQGERKVADRAGRRRRGGFEPRRVQAVLIEGGTLTRAELLRCQVRYFSDGVVFGAQAYVEEVRLRHKCRIRSKRLACRIAELMEGDFYTLDVRPVGISLPSLAA